MADARTANILGALAIAVSDRIRYAAEQRAAHGAAAPAALVLIGSHPGQSIDVLSRALRLSHSGTVRLVDRLGAEGLVERRRGADGRSVALTLSESGHERMEAILAERREGLQRILRALSPQELDDLTRITEKLLAHVGDSRSTCRLCETRVCLEQGCPVPAQGRDEPHEVSRRHLSMYGLPYLSSTTASDLLRAVARMDQTTGEPWEVDWDRFVLTCRHGVSVSVWSALSEPADLLHSYAAGQHAEPQRPQRSARGR